LCTAYKILANVLYSRLRPYPEEIIGEYQEGFQSGRSTTDQIFTMRQILEKCWEQNIETHHPFVDFKSGKRKRKYGKTCTN
jgi:sorting nexin-29